MPATVSTAIVTTLQVLIPVTLLLLAIALFWYLMWKFVLESNPLVRDFFDLDLKIKIPSKQTEKTVDGNAVIRQLVHRHVVQHS
jgi:hypothetical protein